MRAGRPRSRGAFLRPAVRIIVKNGAGGRFSARLGRCSALPSRPPARPLALRAAKGKRAKGNYFLSRRKPRLPRLPGEYPLRSADRQNPALLSQQPPRYTRCEPELGPTGSVTVPPR